MSLSPAEFKKGVEVIKRWKNDPVKFVVDQLKVERMDPWQEEILRAFPTHNRIGMKACKGPGKGQWVEDTLYTPEGKRRWGDLEIGDSIFAEDGSETTVTAIYRRGVIPFYRVVFDDGSDLECSHDHLWKVRGRTERRHDTWSVLTTEQIIARGVRERNGKWAGRHFEIPRQGAVKYPQRDLPMDAYALGVWIGDGDKNGGRMSGEAIEIDRELVRHGVKIRRRADGHGKNICVSLYGLQGALREIGLLMVGSHERFIPELYKTSSISQRTDLLTGLMDTDGCIDDDGSMEYDTTSKRLAEDVVWLVRSLGGVSYVKDAVKKPFYYSKSREKIAGRHCYRVTLKLPFCPFNVKKKSERWKPANTPEKLRYMTRHIDRIEKIEPKDCTCIEVSHPSKCYLAKDFIVTHNTAVLAWLSWNFLATRPDPKIIATSITGDNLNDNLWPEMSKWQSRSEFLKRTFEWSKTRIYSKSSPETWFMSARSWSRTSDQQKQSEALAGTHADYVMFVLDEAGGIPDAVAATAEGGLATGKETKLLMAGNPTNLEGPLYRACTSQAHLWFIREITGDPKDPKRSTRVSAQWAQEQIDTYGADNPWVLVNVFGKFPPASLNTLLGPDEVEAAMKRDIKPPDYDYAQKRIGLDVARFGDDRIVMYPRQGLRAFPPVVMRNATGPQIASRIILAKEKWNWEVCYVDDTGGYGASAIDSLMQSGHVPIAVNFAGKADDPRYFNRRAEMHFRLAEWVKRGGVLPDSPALKRELTAPTYTFVNGKFQLEDKKLIKARLGFSPDEADALALTFAQAEMPTAGSGMMAFAGRGARLQSEFDPYSETKKPERDYMEEVLSGMGQ